LFEANSGVDYSDVGIYTVSQKSSHLLTVCNFVKS